jgi:O-antigen/teichoic acid export membrane protein
LLFATLYKIPVVGRLLKKPDDPRDALIRRNVVSSLFYQFLTNLLGLLVVPLSLSYLNKENYGIWINASLIVSWLQNMNFGMGFGMQNHVAESIAKDDEPTAREYVSITYKYSTLIAAGMLAVASVCLPFVNWKKSLQHRSPR